MLKNRCYVVVLLFYTTSCFSQTDINWLRAVHEHRNTSFDGSMKGLSASTYPMSIAAPLLIAGAGYATHNKELTRKGFTIALAAVGTAVGVTMIKETIKRDRPFVTYPDITPVVDESSYSMPSGHTSFAFSTATSLSLAFPKWYVIVPSYLWASGVGYSRLHLGVHYPSDVMIGALVGAGSAYVSYRITRWLNGYYNQKHSPI